ncbi:MAG TPA: S41 family peptidase, partial [Burkholderiaceae bacterium]
SMPPPPVASPPPATSGTSAPPILAANLPRASAVANVCTPEGEKTWIRSHLNDVYLWYDEIVDVPPANYSTPLDYYAALLVKSRDRFSHAVPAAASSQYYEAGVEAGHGWNLVNQAGRLLITGTDPGSPAARAGIGRGAQIVAIDGAEIGQVTRPVQLATLYPELPGVSVAFDILDPGATAPRRVTLVSETVTIEPVQHTRVIANADNSKTGYLLFTDHIATAEAPLIAAMRQFQNAGVNDVVLDLRYNGGGYLYIASILASMIGGDQVQGKMFENYRHNDKLSYLNTGVAFANTGTRTGALPRLNLPRVFVLTSSRTCSASESVINGLRPFLNVITIGTTTCGKPYGMRQANNCGMAYYPIEIAGSNHIGFGDFTGGFAPTCTVSDDMTRPLGDASERVLAAALNYAKTGLCPVAGTAQAGRREAVLGATDIEVIRPWRQQLLVK